MSSYISSKEAFGTEAFKISRLFLLVLILHFIFDFFIGKTAHVPPVNMISGGRYNILFLHVFETNIHIIFFQSTPPYWHFDLKSMRELEYIAHHPFLFLCSVYVNADTCISEIIPSQYVKILIPQ